MKDNREGIIISENNILNAFDAYINGLLLEKQFDELNIPIIHNPNYDVLSNLPFVICVEVLCELSGVNYCDDSMVERVGQIFVRTASKAILKKGMREPEELFELCIRTIERKLL